MSTGNQREAPNNIPWFSFTKADRRVTCYYFYSPGIRRIRSELERAHARRMLATRVDANRVPAESRARRPDQHLPGRPGPGR